METHVLKAELREKGGKGAARSARRAGKVPGVIYGGGKPPVMINVNFNELYKLLKAGRFLSSLTEVQTDDGAKHLVLCRDVQRNVINGLPIHVDFMRVTAKQRIEVFVPVEFLNEEECKGIKRGGTLVVVRPEVELEVPADNIPEKLVVDLLDYDIGDVIHISNVELPAGAEPVIKDRDFVIANISAPSGFTEAAEGEEGEEGEGAEEA